MFTFQQTLSAEDVHVFTKMSALFLKKKASRKFVVENGYCKDQTLSTMNCAKIN